jgi:2-polyprenyl-6-methoxyphenol hydroxylase-like FAD-dependent oxidoreductase
MIEQTDHAVVIAGAGSTGMMLAAELTLAAVDVIVEPRPRPDFVGSRSGGLHARTIEVLDQRGIADRFLEAGPAVQVQSFADVSLDIENALARWFGDPKARARAPRPLPSR